MVASVQLDSPVRSCLQWDSRCLDGWPAHCPYGIWPTPCFMQVSRHLGSPLRYTSRVPNRLVWRLSRQSACHAHDNLIPDLMLISGYYFGGLEPNGKLPPLRLSEYFGQTLDLPCPVQTGLPLWPRSVGRKCLSSCGPNSNRALSPHRFTQETLLESWDCTASLTIPSWPNYKLYMYIYWNIKCNEL